MRISSEETFDCTGYEEDSFHPISNGNDCRSYWHCVHVDTVHMQAVKRICPLGTGFDFQSNQCQWMNAVSVPNPPLTLIEDVHSEELPINFSSITDEFLAFPDRTSIDLHLPMIVEYLFRLASRQSIEAENSIVHSQCH